VGLEWDLTRVGIEWVYSGTNRSGLTNSVRDFGQTRNKPDKREMKPASFRYSVEMKPASFRYIGFSVEIQPASFRYNRLHFDTSASFVEMKPASFR
jgi:hypothetical protein